MHFLTCLARTERDDGRLLRVVSGGEGCDLVDVSPFDFSVASETVFHVTDSFVVAEDKVRVEASVAIAEQDFGCFLDLPGWLKVRAQRIAQALFDGLRCPEKERPG